MLNLLKGASVVKDTTSARVEKKTVISESYLQEQLANLEQPLAANTRAAKATEDKVTFSARDVPPPGGANMTFTFYGRGMFFENFGVKTKIKLRARFYLQSFKNSGELNRSPGMEDFAYLELKVKNPSPELLNSVEKYRVKIRDEDLFRLYQLEPDSPHFAQDLDAIRQGLLEYPGQRKKSLKLVHAIIAVVAELARQNRDFVRPAFAISYLREAAKYVEPAPTLALGRQANGWIGRQAKRAKLNPVAQGVEYQLTLDRHVFGYAPKLDFAANGDFTFISYFREQAPLDLRVRYPENAVVVELKVPIEIANRAKNKRSRVQDHIATVFSEPTFNPDAAFPGFSVDKGKASVVRRALNGDLPDLAVGLESPILGREFIEK